MFTKRLILAVCALALVVATGCGRHRCCGRDTSASFAPPCCPTATVPPPGLPPGITP